MLQEAVDAVGILLGDGVADIRLAAQLHRRRQAGGRNRRVRADTPTPVEPGIAPRLVERIATGPVGPHRPPAVEPGRPAGGGRPTVLPEVAGDNRTNVVAG